MGCWLPVSYIKRRLSITDPDGVHRSDDLLELVAKEACGWVESETGRKFETQTWRMVFDGAGSDRLWLPGIPVTAVSELKIWNQPIAVGTAEEFQNGAVRAYWDSEGITFPQCFPCGRAAILAEWSVGYAEGAVPDQVLGLATSVAILKFRDRDRTGAASTAIGGQSIVYSRELPPLERSILESLREWSLMYRPRGSRV